MKNDSRRAVALIYGGRGAEAPISVLSAEYVLPLIDRKSYLPLAVFITPEGQWLYNGRQVCPAYMDGVSGLLSQSGMIPVDCALPLLHGDFGEDGVVQGALKNAKIPFVGSDVCASAVTSDKAITKAVAQSLEIPTLPYTLVGSEADLSAKWLPPFPLFVKPTSLGSSIGAGVARDLKELTLAVRNALSLCPRVMIEPYLEGVREIECGYFSSGDLSVLTECGEIVSSCGFYDYDSKYRNAGDVKISLCAHIPENISGRVRQYSKMLIDAIGITDLCRVDFFLFGESLYFNEINSIPGFTSASLYPRMLEAAGIPPALLLDRLIDKAMGREG